MTIQRYKIVSLLRHGFTTGGPGAVDDGSAMRYRSRFRRCLYTALCPPSRAAAATIAIAKSGWFFHGDIPAGTIGERAGVPADLDQWNWTCGFYPGVEPRKHRHGAAPTFEEARAGFEEAWHLLLPTLTEAPFDEWCSDRDFRAQIREKRDRGEKLDTEMPSSMMRCVCGEMFDSHDPNGSLPHRRHIYATQAEQKC